MDLALKEGLGRLLGPWQLMREERAKADANRYAKLSIAQAEKEVELVRSGRADFVKDGTLKLIESENNSEERLPANTETEPDYETFIKDIILSAKEESYLSSIESK